MATIQSLRTAMENAIEWSASFITQRKWRRIFLKNTTYRLTKEQQNACKAFYKYCPKFSSVFHAFYTEKTGRFDVRYIPDDMYYGYIDRYLCDYKSAGVLDNKCFYKAMFGDRIKQPDVFAYRLGPYWYDEQMNMITTEALYEAVDSAEALVIKKASDSCGDKGVSFIERKDGPMKELFDSVVNTITGDIVIQYPVHQHHTMSALHDASVNTVRLLSLFRNGEVKIYSTIVRIGIGGAKVDNASSGGITCGVLPDGRLKDCAYTASGKKFLEHPTNGVKFNEIVVPSFDRMQDAVKKLHTLFPRFRNISWDFSVDENGEPVLIEVNLRCGELDFHQLNNGPLFGDDTEEILSAVFHNKKL